MTNDALAKLDAVWRTLRRVDKYRLANGRKKLIESIKAGKVADDVENISSFLKRIESAASRSLVTAAEKLVVDYPENLPITAFIPQVKEALKAHNVIIVCGATGSGKTTQLPKAVLELGLGRYGSIGCTQPRRLAATALAERFAFETGAELGKEVGMKIRFDDRTSDSTVVKFMTDGILLAETRSDPDLLQYDCLILDEVHERSLNIDFLLGYVKKLLTKRRDLKIVISSATLEAGSISAFFDNAPIVEIPGGLFPIEDIYMPPEEEGELGDAVAKALEFLYDLDPAGDVLVFLPGEREIRDMLEFLSGRKLPRTELLPLFGRLSASEQGRIFQRSRFRRVILSTNVAETSLTIPGIRFVVDSGLVRLSRYNPRTRIQELRVEPVSQAGARQRRGRCGRLSDGVCVRLYSEEDLKQSPEYTPPEIQRSSLAGVILQMALLKLPPVAEFPFVDPPGPALVREGMRTLDDLHAIENGRLTPNGKRLAALPIDPHLGQMLLYAQKCGVLPFLCVITSFLSISDPHERPMEEIKAADEAHKRFRSDVSDFLGIINLWSAACKARGENNSNSGLRKFSKQFFLNYKRMTEWRNLAFELADEFSVSLDCVDAETSLQEYDAIHKSILSGLPRQMAVFDKEKKFFRDMANKVFLPFPASGLAKRKKAPDWIMFFALMETSRVFGRVCAEVNSQWLQEVAPQLCKAVYDDIHFDERSGFVYARERLTAGSLLIHPGRRRNFSPVDPVQAREVFIREGLVEGKVSVPGCRWLEDYNAAREMLSDLEIRMRRSGGMIDEDAIFDHFNRVLPPDVCSAASVKQHWQRIHKSFAPEPEEIVFYPELLADCADYPDTVTSGGVKLRVRYLYDVENAADGVTLCAKAGELNLVNQHILDYGVPGFLAQKIEYMFRALPKAIRRELQPMAETAAGFMTLYRQKKILTEQPLSEAVREYLAEYLETDVPVAVLENIDYPEYLVTKLAICDDNGKIRKVTRTFPGKEALGSRLSKAIPSAQKYASPPGKIWPGLHGELPGSVPLSKNDDRLIYPALTVENGLVGCSSFLEEREAVLSHRAGVLKLFSLTAKMQTDYWKSKLRISNELKLTLFLNYPDWKEDLMDLAVLFALRSDPADIRTQGAFEQEQQEALDKLGPETTRLVKELELLTESVDKARSFLRRLPEYSWTKADASALLDYLLRPGFLRCAEAVGEYTRYMKSLNQRLERAAGGGSARDESKGEGIQPYISRFRLAAEKCDISVHAGLLDFFLLLQEARIAAFTPEIRARKGSTPAALAAAWDSLRLS
ncbi:MAG: ATP-dependent RNA helicase HrpA [Lentisphaeria bacterium]|nr:ATP-dependent RNA helicase HrpA [Lentisphaeria bacterium]